MPVHFHPPDAAAGLPGVSFSSFLTRGSGGARAYAALEMELDGDEHHQRGDAKHHPAAHHEPQPTRRVPERVPSAPELYALSMAAVKAARAHPGAPKAWRRVDAAGEVTLLQVRLFRGPMLVRKAGNPFWGADARPLRRAQADKHSIAQRCAIPLRDLRILDVELSTRRVRGGRPPEHGSRRNAAERSRAARAAAFPRRCCRASAPSSSTSSTSRRVLLGQHTIAARRALTFRPHPDDRDC